MSSGIRRGTENAGIEFETDWDRFACIEYNRLAMEEEAQGEEATVDDDEEDVLVGGNAVAGPHHETNASATIRMP